MENKIFTTETESQSKVISQNNFSDPVTARTKALAIPDRKGCPVSRGESIQNWRKTGASFILRVCLNAIASQEFVSFHAETYIPTQPPQTVEEARLSFADEDQERRQGAVAPSRQGAQARLGEARLPRVVLPKLRNPREQQPQAEAGGIPEVGAPAAACRFRARVSAGATPLFPEHDGIFFGA